MRRKQESAERIEGIKAGLDQHCRQNRALRVGRVEPLIVDLLARLVSTQLAPHTSGSSAPTRWGDSAPSACRPGFRDLVGGKAA